MKLTDSHFRHRPIQSLIEYANRVGCQYHWTAYDRHHLHFFKEAGLSNPFWVPGAFSIQPYAANVSQHKLYEVLFCGANSLQIHPRRATLLAALQKAGVKLTVTRKSYTDSLDAYTAAKIVFNCSLNGDLNRRVFEVLMAGGFLLTDRLAPESGLPELFQEGVHLECYGSKQELLEKVNYYLAHPAHADRIAQQGHEHFMKHYHPFQLEEQFLNIVVKGQSIPDLLLATKDDRTQRPVQSSSERLHDRLRIYELVHELHRCNEQLTLLDYSGQHPDLIADLRDLPRLRVFSTDEDSEKAAIILIDCPETVQQLESLLKQLRYSLQAGGVLLVVGREVQKFDNCFNQLGWISINLQESGEAACRVYASLVTQASPSERLILPISPVTTRLGRRIFALKTTAKRVLYSISFKHS
jgi:hypothetical protein